VGLTAPAELWLASLGQPGGGLLLDLDGTLLDSEPVHQAAFRAYFATRGWDVADDVVRQFAGRRAQEVFPTLDGPWAGEDPELLTSAVLAALARSTLRPEPVPGAVRLLAACARSGLPVAVVTSATRGWVAAAWSLLGQGGPAVLSVTAEDCVRGKPDPEPFRRGSRLLGLRPQDLIAVEDSPAGIASGRAAGVGHLVGVTTTQDAAMLVTAGAHETGPDLLDLALAVEQLAARD